jgi:hypothetical protein
MMPMMASSAKFAKLLAPTCAAFGPPPQVARGRRLVFFSYQISTSFNGLAHDLKHNLFQ